MFCLMGCCLGFLRSGSRWNGTSGIKGILFINLSLALFVLCMLFVFPVTISVLPGISCDTSDGWFMAWLMGSGFLLFDPALPCPIHSLSDFPCLGIPCCFLVLSLGLSFFYSMNLQEFCTTGFGLRMHLN